MEKPEPTYIAVDALGKPLDEATLLDIEEIIRQKDGVQNPVLSYANDSTYFAELVEPMDFTNPAFWDFLVVLIVSVDGSVNGYQPNGRMVEFVERAAPGVSSYELLADILELNKD